MCAAKFNYPSNAEEQELYDIDYSRPGLVYVFNNINFKHPGFKDRSGAKNDQRRVVDLFKELKFQVKYPFVNMTLDETQETLEDLGTRDYSDVGCLFVFIMSHGEMGAIYSSDCKKILLEDFFTPFERNKSLKHKPKLFFVQSCRGKDENAKYVEVDKVEMDRREIEASKVPIVADFLYAYACTDNTLAPRDPANGAWFIQILCDVIEKDKSENFIDILTMVNNKISRKEGELSDRGKVVSISKFESQLRKKLFIAKPKVYLLYPCINFCH